MSLVSPGDIVTFHYQTIDAETGFVDDTTYPAIVVKLQDNLDPPADDMTDWAWVVPFNEDGPFGGHYAYHSDPPRNGSYSLRGEFEE